MAGWFTPSRWKTRSTRLLLEIRRAESAARGYLLTSGPQFLTEHKTAVAAILPDLDKLARLTGDNPVQVENIAKLRDAIETRLAEFAKGIDFVEQNDVAGGIAMLRGRPHQRGRATPSATSPTRCAPRKIGCLRCAPTTADRTQQLASIVTVAGSGLVIALAGISIFLVRRSARARDDAEARLRDNNLNLEATVDERTADLREANDEIQRFAYIVSHDLRSPLVNIMGFTSELEELRGDIFRRIATLGRAGDRAPLVPADAGDDRAGARRRGQAALAGFHRGARLHQILDRQDGPPDHGDPQPHPRGPARIPAGARSTPAN